MNLCASSRFILLRLTSAFLVRQAGSSESEISLTARVNTPPYFALSDKHTTNTAQREKRKSMLKLWGLQPSICCMKEPRYT